MELYLGLISNWGVPIIVISGIVLLVFMVQNAMKISNEKSRIEELHNHITTKYKRNKTTHELVVESDDDSLASPEKFLEYEREFNALCSTHNAMSQMIPIFPLLGILGTVAGLMLNARSGNIDEMLVSLNTALGTTFAGLLSAIVLKTFDAWGPSKMINDVNIIFDDYDAKFKIAETFDEIPEKVKR